MRKSATRKMANDARLAPERLYRVASAALRRALGNGFDGREDLVQEVLERVLRGVSEGRFGGLSSLSTWVSAIAQHVAMEELRTVTRARVAQGEPMPNTIEALTPIDLEHQLEARSTLAQARRLLTAMDPTTCRVIVLHDLYGHELSDVAALTDLTLAAVQSRLVRGRKALLGRLRNKLGAEDGLGSPLARAARAGGTGRRICATRDRAPRKAGVGAACATQKAMTRTPQSAADIMSRDLVTLEETQNLMFLPEVMKLFRFRHMPVVDGNRLVGLVTERDILRVSASSLLPTAHEQTDYLAKKFVVRDMMTRDVQTVHPETPLMEVAQRMRRDKLGCMPVVEGENTLVGIITEADFVTLSTRLLPTPV